MSIIFESKLAECGFDSFKTLTSQTLQILEYFSDKFDKQQYFCKHED